MLPHLYPVTLIMLWAVTAATSFAGPRPGPAAADCAPNCERTLDTTALFVGRSGTRLTIYSIENIFKKHVRLADIKRHITPHALRHTMAAMLVSRGTDIREVQEILGHASILSTQVYMKLPIQKGRRAAAAMPAMRVFPEVTAPKLPIKKR